MTRTPIPAGLIGLVLAGAALATDQTAAAPKVNPAIAAMGDNTWLKLNLPREPRSRMYCGCCLGDGLLWFFGGGHGGYKYNDVELYDLAANRWTQATEPEDWQKVKGAEGMGGGWGVPVLSPRQRPLGEHTYQQFCWLPEQERFFGVLSASGTWEFDPVRKEWQPLAGLHAGKTGPLTPFKFDTKENNYRVLAWKTRDGREVVSTRDGWQTTDSKPAADVGSFNPSFQVAGGLVVYDPVLKKPLCLARRTVWAFEHPTRKWEKLTEAPFAESAIVFSSTYLPDHGCHIIVHRGGQPATWWRFDAVKREFKPIEKVPKALAASENLTYDTANKVVLALGGEDDKPGFGTLWAFDPAAGKFSKLAPANAGPPVKGNSPVGRWNTLWYDTRHNACILVCQPGQGGNEGQPCETWAYRHKQVSGR